MSMKEHPSENDSIERDTVYSPSSNAETRERQQDPDESPATDDPDIDDESVKVLPGTGGPDDSGDIEVSAEDIDFDEIRGDGSAR